MHRNPQLDAHGRRDGAAGGGRVSRAGVRARQRAGKSCVLAWGRTRAGSRQRRSTNRRRGRSCSAGRMARGRRSMSSARHRGFTARRGARDAIRELQSRGDAAGGKTQLRLSVTDVRIEPSDFPGLVDRVRLSALWGQRWRPPWEDTRDVFQAPRRATEGEEESGLQGYPDATPEQVAEALVRHRASPGPKPKNKRWL